MITAGTILLMAESQLMVICPAAENPGDHNDSGFSSAESAQNLGPNGDMVKGEIRPYAKLYIFRVERGSGNKIIDGYDALRGDKIRLTGFGLTEFDAVRRLLQQVGDDVMLTLPNGQALWILHTSVEALAASNFQLELDHRGLIKTFDDEFTEFSWYAEGLKDAPTGGGTWRTNFGYAGVQGLGSRTLGSNGELQVYVDRGFRGTSDKPLGIDPFRIANGSFQIVGDRAPDEIRSSIWNYEYTSGVITTQFSFAQRYGIFEIRARMPKGHGLWPCFWLMPTDHSWPPELDVLEILGNDTTLLHTNVHSKATGKHTDAPTVVRIPDASADFHTYAVDWEPDTIGWFSDGVEVARVPTPDVYARKSSHWWELAWPSGCYDAISGGLCDRLDKSVRAGFE
jgi:hypothetical protein